jgi:hypothetical protein
MVNFEETATADATNAPTTHWTLTSTSSLMTLRRPAPDVRALTRARPARRGILDAFITVVTTTAVPVPGTRLRYMSYGDVP